MPSPLQRQHVSRSLWRAGIASEGDHGMQGGLTSWISLWIIIRGYMLLKDMKSVGSRSIRRSTVCHPGACTVIEWRGAGGRAVPNSVRILPMLSVRGFRGRRVEDGLQMPLEYWGEAFYGNSSFRWQCFETIRVIINSRCALP